MIVTIKKCGVHVSVFTTLGKQKGSSGRFLVIFTERILNGKLHFLFSDSLICLCFIFSKTLNQKTEVSVLSIYT